MAMAICNACMHVTLNVRLAVPAFTTRLSYLTQLSWLQLIFRVSTAAKIVNRKNGKNMGGGLGNYMNE
jgi:hypothetical protein